MLAALEQLRTVLVTSEGRPIDPVAADWGEIEKGVILLLGGGFQPDRPQHLEVGFMLAAALAERLRTELGAFWFQNRATPHGASVGFPGALVMFSPLDAVFQALGRAKLGTLGTITEELRQAVTRNRGTGGERPLGPEDYQRIFDPGLVQFAALDPAALTRTLGTPVESLVRDFEHGFSKLSREIPEQARTQVTREVVGALGRLAGAETLGEQIPRAPQLAELVALATSAVATTGIAPVEFWEQLLMPLLHVGAPDNFAELEDEELELYKQGADPLLLYVDVVPYRTPAADEDGLLGVFPPEQVKLLDARWADGQGARLLHLDLDVMRPLCAAFDPEATRAAIDRFAATCAAAAGEPGPRPAPPDRPPLRDMVLMLAADLKRLVAQVDEKGLGLVLRYMTEGEASSEPILQDLRRGLREPRIILT
jgi:plasmid stabilization system protein ParE